MFNIETIQLNSLVYYSIQFWCIVLSSYSILIQFIFHSYSIVLLFLFDSYSIHPLSF